MVFYGSMISESIIALIWAGVAMAFFHGTEGLIAALAEHGNNAAWAVNTISTTTLGLLGGFLAMLGVVAAPITSGDTAFRSARLIVADIFHIEQRSIPKRLAIAAPLFATGIVLTFIDFDIIWRYFAWANQTLSIFTLWMIVVYLKQRKRNFWLALFPAIFMTYVCLSFMFVSGQFFGMGPTTLAYFCGGVTTLVFSLLILKFARNAKKNIA
jgi:carbon starvation protein CstA